MLLLLLLLLLLLVLLLLVVVVVVVGGAGACRLLASCSLWLACLFSLACWLSPAGIHLPPADFRLLASCSRLLAVACCLLQASTIAIARIQHIGGRNAGPPGVAALRRRSRDPDGEAD